MADDSDVRMGEWDEEASNEQSFNRHADAARRLATVFEEHGAEATFEARPEFVEACTTWNDNVLLELYERGHGLGVHADVGGSVEAEGLTQKDFAAKIAEMKNEMKELTGIDSTLDWVVAAADAGYGFTTRNRGASAGRSYGNSVAGTVLVGSRARLAAGNRTSLRGTRDRCCDSSIG